MNYTRILICVFIMALVTYLPRMLPLAIFQKKIENKFVKSFLAYVPYAVLGAMTFPEILYSTSSMISGFIGFIIAVILAYKNKSLLTVAIGGTVTVFITELILNFVAK